MRFYAAVKDDECPNGAIGWSSGGMMDCLGPYAKVQNCPIDGTTLRLTCYATNYADSFFSIPAYTRYKGNYIRGFFTRDESGTVFMVMDSHKHLIAQLADKDVKETQ